MLSDAVGVVVMHDSVVTVMVGIRLRRALRCSIKRRVGVTVRVKEVTIDGNTNAVGVVVMHDSVVTVRVKDVTIDRNTNPNPKSN